MLHPFGREKALFRQIGDAAKPAGFLVRRAGNLDGTGKIGVNFQKRLCRNDRRGKPTLHVTGAPAKDLVARNRAAERIGGPAGSNGNHIDM